MHVCLIGKSADEETFCPFGWGMKNTKCYWIPNINMTFFNAAKKCEEYGAKLFEPQNLDHLNEIMDLLKRSFGNRKIWIGIEDIDIEGTFVYHNTKIQLKFSAWNVDQNEPNNMETAHGPGGQDCVIVTDG